VGLSALVEALPSFNAFAEDWQVALDRRLHAAVAPKPWTDHAVFAALAELLTRRPPASIHFANSTAARLLQKVDWPTTSRLHANRGVAGIDGCTSTAVGDALRHPDQEVVLITGDTAWLYDLNGLHVQPFPSNLRVVVIDNAGGQIFRWLPGPTSVGLTEPYFAAPPTASLRPPRTFIASISLAVQQRKWSGFRCPGLGWSTAAPPCSSPTSLRGHRQQVRGGRMKANLSLLSLLFLLPLLEPLASDV
jgi:hypothetical protein